jgi:hypothetical protein
MATVFWPSMRNGFMELARYTTCSAASRFTISMQPSKSVSSPSTSAPWASGCTSWPVVILPRGKSTTTGSPAAAP